MLFVTASAYPLGGVATWLDYVVPGLRGMGWEAKVGLVRGRWHDPETYLKDHPHLPVVTIDNPTGTREGRVRSLARVMRREKPEIVAGVNIPDAYEAVARGGRPARAPRVVMTTHSLEPDLYEDMREFGDLLDGVVCTNRLACSLAVADAGIEPRRVHYAPYGVAPSAVSGRRAPDSSLRIAFVGRLEEGQKRVGTLAAVAESLAGAGFPFRLDVVGDGPDAPALRTRLAPLVSRGLVRFAGAVSHAEVQERILPESDVLLLTSSWETGPLVIWEAMANGIAVVSSRYVGSGLEDALGHGRNCLLFDTGDAAGAARCLLQAADPATRARLAEAGRDLVAERYTIERSVQAWERAFTAVLAAAPSDGRARRREPVAAGRMDRWIGRGLAETVRRVAGRSFEHRGPGGEWPHSYGRRKPGDPRFLELAARLDRGGFRETAAP